MLYTKCLSATYEFVRDVHGNLDRNPITALIATQTQTLSKKKQESKFFLSESPAFFTSSKTFLRNCISDAERRSTLMPFFSRPFYR